MSQSPLAERLKQSSVVQAVVIFLGASWVVLQVVDLLQERLGLPEWVFPVTLILLVIGFVIVLATAWVQSRPSTTAAEEAGEIPTDWEVAPADALQSLKQGRLPHLTWGRAVVAGAGALAVLFGFAGVFLIVTGESSSLGPAEIGAGEAATGIAILPFEVNNPELGQWEEGIVDLLAPGLDGVAGYRTIPSRTVLARWRNTVRDAEPDLATTLEVGGATGARYGITGSVVALGPSVRLNAGIYDLADGTKVADGVAEGPAEDVLALVDELGLDAMRNLMAAVGGEGVEAGLPARITTASLESARAFLEGEEHYRAGRFEDAVRAYEQAMAADPDFGLPVFRASVALDWYAELAEQEAMDRRLEGILDRLSARDRTLALTHLQLDGDSLRSMGPVETAVLRYPNDPEAWFALGEARYHESGIAGGGNGPAREAFERAIELSPGFLPYYYHALDYAIAASDRVRAEALLSELESAAPDDPSLPEYRFLMALVFADLEEARRQFLDDLGQTFGTVLNVRVNPHLAGRLWDLISALPSAGEIRLTDLKSTTAMAAGRQAEALELLQAIPLGTASRVTLARHHQDVLGALPGFDGDAEYAFENCGDPGLRSQVSCHEKAALHQVDQGRPGAARPVIAQQDSIADAYRADDPIGSLIHRRIARTVEGYIAWKAGDLQGALDSFAEARRTDRFGATVRWLLADLFVETGQPLAAVDLLLSLDDNITWSPFARLKAAEVLESLGDGARAAEHYREALAAWVGADEDFEPKGRAQAGLARVDG